MLKFCEHAEVLRLMSPTLEDLVIGWPTAALLALAGGIVYGTEGHVGDGANLLP